ncbi:MAG: YlxR family protein [Pseudomonadota bacterium]
MKHEPVRTCIVCRKQRGKKELMRLVCSSDGVVQPDYGQKLAGRGAYLCRDANCLSIAHEKGRLKRAFRRKAECRYVFN